VQIRTPDEYTGWTLSSGLVHVPPGEAVYANFGEVAQVTSLAANLYRETDITKHAPILELPFDSMLEIVSGPTDNGRWFQVRLPDLRVAWIPSGDITGQPRTISIPESIELAKRFLGVTYTWGGRSSFGFDCSGFTQMILHHRGINIPRDADLQAAWSGVVSVERKNLKPGDLLFFGSSAEHITHTGMYIGNGEFIHDTTHDRPMVQISRLDDQPWTRLRVACRRVK
jgi:cell wall-associated NlpC family hydrolase